MVAEGPLGTRYVAPPRRRKISRPSDVAAARLGEDERVEPDDLAERVDDENLKNLMLGLAQEEAKHKLRFEIEYDERILGEN